MRADDGASDVRGVLSVAVLGLLEVMVAGRLVVFTAGRLQTLVAVLAMSAGETVSLDYLAAAVWEESLPADVRKTVQTYVTRLRAILGADLIGTRPNGYVLHAEPDQVDALRFLRLMDAADVAPDVRAERTRLEEALALWRGMPFEGLRSGWLGDLEAPRLVERYLTAVERRADLDLAAGRPGPLVGQLGGLLARHPLRESLWLRLLVALHRSGRRAEALERYQDIRVRLADELGIDPGAELQRVYADLLADRVPAVTCRACPLTGRSIAAAR
jgi:DNA-binding SARP family transcriptional activator